MFSLFSTALRTRICQQMGRTLQVRLPESALREFRDSQPQSDVKGQVWANMQRNCNFTKPLYVFPTLNQSGPPLNRCVSIFTKA
jgi:hypothetical protein